MVFMLVGCFNVRVKFNLFPTSSSVICGQSKAHLRGHLLKIVRKWPVTSSYFAHCSLIVGRLFVERYIHDEFIERMVEEVKKMKIGDPLDRSVAHGPQNHK